MKMTIYVPDGLAAEIKDKLGDSDVSAICQNALRAEIARQEARAAIGAEGFERIEVYDSRRGAEVAFRGRRIAADWDTDAVAYLTPKDAIAVYDEVRQDFYVYDDYREFAAEADWSPGFIALVAEAIGEKYVEELDI
jgi:post-segregation antitoxin (ccd killing protein)